MYPISIDKRAESDLCASACAHAIFNIIAKHFVRGGAVF